MKINKNPKLSIFFSLPLHRLVLILYIYQQKKNKEGRAEKETGKSV